MAPKQAPQVLECQSVVAYIKQLNSLRDTIALPESEETWDKICHAMLCCTALIRGNAANASVETASFIRSISQPLNSAVNSERSRLSGVAIELVTTLAASIGQSFEHLIPLFFPTLLTLSTRPNKVFRFRARLCLLAIVEHAQSPTVLSYFVESAKDKSGTLRLIASECALACLHSLNPPDLEKEPRAREVESMIRIAAVDASADVRKVGRKIFEAYKLVLPARVERFTQPLTPTIKKYLDIKLKPASTTQSNPNSRPPSAQSHHSAQPSLDPEGQPFTEVPAQRSTRGKGDMPPPSVIPDRATKTTATGGTSGRMNATRPQIVTSASSERLFQSDSNVGRPGPSRVGTVTSSRDELGTQSQRPQRGKAGPIRAKDVTQEQVGRTRIGPIRPTSSLAAMPPPGQDPADRATRVLGGARRVLRVPPPQGSVASSSDRRVNGPIPPPRASDRIQPFSRVSLRQTAQEGKLRVSAKPSAPKAAERVKLVPKPADVQRAFEVAAGSTGRAENATSSMPGNLGEPSAVRTGGGEVTSIGVEEEGPRPHERIDPSKTPGEMPEAPPPVEMPLPPGPSQSTIPPVDIPVPPSSPHVGVSGSPTHCKLEVMPDTTTPDRLRNGLEYGIAATPISSLVADIERGFLFTPAYPLSPAGVYAEQTRSLPIYSPLRALKTSIHADKEE